MVIACRNIVSGLSTGGGERGITKKRYAGGTVPLHMVISGREYTCSTGEERQRLR